MIHARNIGQSAAAPSAEADPAVSPLAASRTPLRLGVVLNPGSGANLKSPGVMRRVLEAHPQIPFREVSDPASVERALDELSTDDIDTLVVSGGDGPVQAVLNTLLGCKPFRTMPRLALLHSGTTNMNAADAGFGGRPERALAGLIERAGLGLAGFETTQRHIMRIDRGAGRRAIYGMSFGAAAIYQGVHYCRSKVHTMGLRGEIGPGIALLRFVVALARGEHGIAAPVPMSMVIDGLKHPAADCGILHVTTLDRLFLGMRPFWGEESAPLRLTCVRSHPRYLLRALPGLLRGRRNRWITPENGYISHNAQRLEFSFDDQFVVDGEFFSTEPGYPLVIADGGALDFLTAHRR